MPRYFGYVESKDSKVPRTTRYNENNNHIQRNEMMNIHENSTDDTDVEMQNESSMHQSANISSEVSIGSSYLFCSRDDNEVHNSNDTQNTYPLFNTELRSVYAEEKIDFSSLNSTHFYGLEEFGDDNFQDKWMQDICHEFYSDGESDSEEEDSFFDCSSVFDRPASEDDSISHLEKLLKNDDMDDTIKADVVVNSLKLASLHEFYQRLLYGTQPVPSGIEISNTLKFFTQSSLSLLKDVEKSPYDMLVSQNYDSERISLFPNLDYRQLYGAVSQLIDVLPSVHTGNTVLGQALLQCLVCLLPFLDHDSIDTLAYTISSAIVVVDEDMHQEIINYLCFHIFPFTIGRRTVDESLNYSSQSVSAVIMIIFEYSKSTAQHGQLLECLMALKTDVVKDILCVIAYGTISARLSAVKLLFYYWPTLIPNSIERRSMTLKFEYARAIRVTSSE
uniref:Uncharacterized protein n=1 Tax=Trichogramma kaykai TaxID=54128 RepID=A0ABD2W2B7_9HYME